jgi:hypothetical protein
MSFGDFLDQGQALPGGVVQGALTNKEAEDLSKALSAGYPGGGNAGGLAGGGVLQAESLEGTLKSVTFEQKNLVFWPSVPVDKAFATVENYNRITGYGGESSPYFAEGGQPGEEDSTYVRDTQRVVFFGTKRKVTHPMMVVRTHTGDIVAQYTKEGTLWLLKSIEREMYWGNAWFSNNGELDGHLAAIPQTSIAMNGLQQQLLRGSSDIQQQSGDFQGNGASKASYKNVGGATLIHDDMEDAALAVFENFGMASDCHMEPAALSAFSKIFYPKERINNMGVADGKAGFVLREFVSSAGTISMKPNVFLRPAQTPSTLLPVQNGPVAPTLGAPASAAVSAGVTPSTFVAGEAYIYKVAAVNDRGSSVPTTSSSVTITADGYQVNMVINATAGAKYYNVYRTNAGGVADTAQFIGSVAPTTPGAAVTFVDRNRKLPGYGEAYLISMAAENLTFKQLTPLSKIDLAITAAAKEWFMILYGCLIVYAPRKNFLLQNVGR